VVAPRVTRALEGYPVPRSVAQLIAVSTACGLATAPVTWFQFRQISLVTVPVAPVAPPVAASLADVNGGGARLLALWARITGGLPYAQITAPRAAAAAAAVSFLAAYAWWRCRTS